MLYLQHKFEEHPARVVEKSQKGAKQTKKNYIKIKSETKRHQLAMNEISFLKKLFLRSAGRCLLSLLYT